MIHIDNETSVTPVKDEGSSVLIEKSVTENGTYEAVNDNADGYSSVDVNVAQGVLIAKTINLNGTYNASDDNADGYSQINVEVEGEYGPSVVLKMMEDITAKSLVTQEVISQVKATYTIPGWLWTDDLEVVSDGVFTGFRNDAYIYNTSVTSIRYDGNCMISIDFITGNDVLSRQGLFGYVTDDNLAFGIENGQFAIIRKFRGRYESDYTEYLGVVKPNTRYNLSLDIHSNKAGISLMETETEETQEAEVALYQFSRGLSLVIQLGRGWTSDSPTWIPFTGAIDVNYATIM